MAMKVYTMEEMLERHIGKVGTPERDEFDRQIKEDIEAYHLGEAIKKMRLEQKPYTTATG